MVATKAEADTCWRSGVQLMTVGVDGEISGDVWAVKELRTISRSDSAIADDRRRRRIFLSPNFDSLANTRQPITDAICGSTYSQHLCDNYCLSNAPNSSIGQNIKSLACPMSDVWCPVSGQSQCEKNFKWP